MWGMDEPTGLSDMTVIAAAEYEGTIRAGTTVQRSAILDMSGPGAEVSRFSSLIHLVLNFRIVPGIAELEAHTVIQLAEYKIAHRLAQTTAELSPEKIVTYELGHQDPDLPNVMLVQGCITDPQHVHSGVGYYGLSLRDSMATFLHPNELFDGAVTVDTTRSGRGYYPTTWDWQNHPLVLGLYAAHGRSLNFGGVILQRIRFETYHGKEVGAQNAARLAEAMKADGVLVTWIGGGNAFVDVMFTIRACERRGIKTTLVTYENGGKEGKDSPVLFYVSEADAVVSTGSLDRILDLPAMDKVIGPYEDIKIFPFPGAAPVSARGPLVVGSQGCNDRWSRYLGAGGMAVYRILGKLLRRPHMLRCAQSPRSSWLTGVWLIAYGSYVPYAISYQPYAKYWMNSAFLNRCFGGDRYDHDCSCR